jgi:phosphomannomutase
LALEFLSRRPNEVILFDVKSSAAAMRIVEEAGGRPQIWKTGHSHMKSRMAEIGCELAGEMSGHIFIKDGYYGFDDALYVAVRVLATMAHTGQTITKFMDNLPPSFTSPECRVDCADDVKFDMMDRLAATAKARYGDRDVLLIDGIRVQDKSGWWLIRASNTEACLVVRAEGIDEGALDAKITELKELLASASIIWDYQPA